MKDIKVLVVDDEKELLYALGNFLKEEGYNLFMSIDGKEALKIVRKENPDVLLLDIRMPNVNGIDVLREVREGNPTTKVIIMTVYDEEYKKMTEEIGIDGFFTKPVQIGKLLQRIREVAGVVEGTRVYPTKEEEPTLPPGMVMSANVLFAEPTFMEMTEVTWHMEEEGIADFFEDIVEYQERVMPKLKEFKPDIVVLSTRLPLKEKHIVPFTTGSLIKEIMSSKYAPKELIVHSSFGEWRGLEKIAREVGAIPLKKTGAWEFEWLAKKDLERAKEIEKLENKKVRRTFIEICLKHNLLKKKEGK